MFIFEKSAYVGVSWNAKCGKWRVDRRANGKQHYGGHFVDELEAAKRSDEFVKELGTAGKLNFPNSENAQKKRVENPRKRKNSPPKKSRKRRKKSEQKKVIQLFAQSISWQNELHNWSSGMSHFKYSMSPKLWFWRKFGGTSGELCDYVLIQNSRNLSRWVLCKLRTICPHFLYSNVFSKFASNAAILVSFESEELAARSSELERENARLRAKLQKMSSEVKIFTLRGFLPVAPFKVCFTFWSIFVADNSGKKNEP